DFLALRVARDDAACCFYVLEVQASVRSHRRLLARVKGNLIGRGANTVQGGGTIQGCKIATVDRSTDNLQAAPGGNEGKGIRVNCEIRGLDRGLFRVEGPQLPACCVLSAIH